MIARGVAEDTNRVEPAMNRGAGNNEIIRPMRLLLGFMASILACAATAPPAFRLPDTAHPTRYELELTIVPRQSEFRGKVQVWLDVSRRAERGGRAALVQLDDELETLSRRRSQGRFAARCVAPVDQGHPLRHGRGVRPRTAAGAPPLTFGP